MKLTCSQMDILISFYFEGELSTCLKKEVEEHLANCETCAAKYDIFKNMIFDLKNSYSEPYINNTESLYINREEGFTNSTAQYGDFRTNLSAYIDNELTSDENIKIKKFAISNSKAREDLEDNYNIRRLMNDSFKKSKAEAKRDFSKKILKQLELEEEISKGFHPAINLLIIFTVTVLIITSIVLVSLSV